jgi:subtilisin family serine protease
MWDQTEDNGIPPFGFTAGTEYTKEQIDEALSSGNPYDIVPEVDFIGHGTAVAGIAAGNGNASNGRFKGVAPESSLIVVKLGEKGRESFARTTELMRALAYVIRKARELNMPIAVNISYGTNNGSHDGTSLFETFVNSMADMWKSVIVVASGNEGSAGHHFEAAVRPGQTLEIPFSVIPNLTSLYITVWKDFVDGMNFELIAPNGQSTGIMDGSVIVKETTIDRTNINIFYNPPSHYSEGQEVYYQFFPDPVIADGVWTLKVTGISIAASGRLNMWLPTVEQVTSRTAFFSPSPEMTFTIPSTTGKVITVGGYDQATGRIADFSGRGFSFYGRLAKPDIVAPAINIMTTAPGGGYSPHSGTSMAAPYAAGASAVLMEWGITEKNDPFLFGQKVSAYLKLGAIRSASVSYPNSVWGYGKLSLRNSLEYLKRR